MSKFKFNSPFSTPASCTLSEGAGFSRLSENDKFVTRNREKKEFVISLGVKYNAQLNDNAPVTPCVSHTGQDKKNAFSLVLDWLQCRYSMGARSFHFDEQNICELSKGEYLNNAAGGFEWVADAYKVKFELLPKATKFCQKVCNVYVTSGGGTTYLGYCCFQPYEGSVLPKDFFQLKIDNSLLYTPYCSAVIDTFQSVTGFDFVGFSRVDIALDTPSDYFRNVCYFDKFQPSEDVLRVGRFEVYYSDVVGGEKIQLGKSTCPKFMVIYNKTKELERSNKQYIKDFHQSNFGNVGDIWRYELRLMNDFFVKINKNKGVVFDKITGKEIALAGLTPQRLLEVGMLSAVYQYGSSVFTKFRKNTDTNITRCEPLRFFEFGRIFTNMVYLDKAAPNALFMVKRATKFLFKEVVYSGLFGAELQSKIQNFKNAYRIVSGYNLHDWLSERVPKWRLDWEKDVFLNGTTCSIDPVDLLGYLGSPASALR